MGGNGLMDSMAFNPILPTGLIGEHSAVTLCPSLHLLNLAQFRFQLVMLQLQSWLVLVM